MTAGPDRDEAVSTPRPPAGALWVRGILWAVLLMVVCGVAAVWWVTDRGARQSRTAVVGQSPELPVYSEIPAAELVASDGTTVTTAGLGGRPRVVDVIFTRCALTCPLMTSKMLALGTELPTGVGRVSISVDPEHDDPETLTEYARSYGIGPDDDWLFLTGTPAAIRQVVLDGLLLGYGETEAEGDEADLEPLTHSSRFVLLDGAGKVRGYYDAFEEGDVDRLVADATTLLHP